MRLNKDNKPHKQKFEGTFAEILRSIHRSKSNEKKQAIDAGIELLLNIERKHEILMSYLLPEPFVEFEDDDEWISNKLTPFINDLYFPLSGAEAQMMSIMGPDGRCFLASFREWGYIMAEWANNSAWNPQQRPWAYIDFYMNEYFGSQMLEFDALMNAFRELINAKDKNFGLHLLG